VRARNLGHKLIVDETIFAQLDGHLALSRMSRLRRTRMRRLFRALKRANNIAWSDYFLCYFVLQICSLPQNTIDVSWKYSKHRRERRARKQ
jgi:hypothetical protein